MDISKRKYAQVWHDFEANYADELKSEAGDILEVKFF
jgi:hypothetical protein